MKNHRKFKFVAPMLLNAWLLALFAMWITLPASAAPPPNSTAVTVYGQSGDFATNDANKGGAGINATNLNGPAGVVLDSSGNLYVADSLNNRVLYYLNGSATATRVYGQAGDLTTGDPNHNGLSAGSLSGPQGVALDSSGNLYVADTGNHRVLRYPAGFTTPDRVYGQGGSYTTNDANKGGAISADTLQSPNGLTLDSSGNLYVADFSNNRVLRYPAGGTTADRVYGQGGDFTTGDANKGGVSGNSLKSPIGVALNADGGLFVADVSNNRVLGYPAGGTTATMVYGQGGSFTTTNNNKDGMNGNSLSLPFAVVVAGGGNLFVADMNNNRVLCYPAGSTTASRVYGQVGDFTTGIVNQGGISANSLKAPAALALDSGGSLYVSDQQNNRVLEYALPVAANGVYGQGGSFTTRNDGGGANATKNSLSYPSTMALDSNGNVYVVDQNNNRVLYYPAGSTTATRVYGQGGSFTSFGQNTGGCSADSLSNPGGIALDGNDNLYVTDANNHRVLFYPAGNTTATRVYGQGGSFTSGTSNNGGIGATSLNSPGGVALDGDGNLYVADTSNNRVLFYPAGNTTATRVYGQGGSFTSGSTNKSGLSANSLYSPYGIILDGSDNLYVADESNNRVLYFASGSTTATRVYGQGGAFNTRDVNKGGLSADSLASPMGVALDGDGNLYVPDRINNRSLYFAAGDSSPTTADLVYGQDGSFTTQDANKGGVSANSLNAPYGITVAGGSLYVSDQLNHRVLKYDLPLVATPDTSAPTVSAFSATTPSASFDIPITAFTSTDNIGATAYLITTSSAQPSAGAAGWSTYAPATYTVAENGNYTLYPWLKDRADNVSAVYGSPLAVLVARPIPTYAVTYNANNPTTGTAPDAQTKTQGIDLTLATNSGSLAKDGYTFAGWNTVADGNGATYSAGATYTTDATLALYANWTAVPLGMTPPGNALVFNGTDQSVSLPASLATNIGNTEAITIEYWFKGSQLQSPVRFQDVNGYIVAGWGASGPKHIISTDGGTDNGLTVGDEGIVENGEWHHLAMTWERNTPNGFKSYLDGILVAQRDSADDALPPLSDATPYLGAFNGRSEFLAGHMDEVRIWNVVRTVTEINNNMRVELTGSESGLVAYYSFNEITGTSLPDVTGKGHTGTLTNMSDANWVASTVPFDTSKAYVTATATGNGSGTVSSSTGGISYGYPATNSGATSAIAKAEGVILTATAGTISTASWTTCTGGTIVGNGTATATCTFSTLDGNKTATVTFTRPPATLYVDKGATGSNNGSSWANAYTDLQSALTASGSTDTILVAQGVYKPTSGTDRSVSFQLKTGVSIYGGYPTGGTGSRTPKTYVTTLSGDIGTEGDSSDNSYAVVNGSGTDNTAILDGFTISGGNANHFDNRTPGDYGAGMYNNAGSPKVQNVTFSNNRAIYDGGGMYNERGSNPVITDVTFADNSANYGGGMYNDSSNPTLTNVTFSNNFTIDAGDGKGDGGGIYNYGSSPSLTNVTFNGNSANYGGGICNGYSSNSGAIPTLMNVTFSNNSATYWGGGMSNSEGSPTLTNCILWGNSPDQIYDFDSTPIVTYSVVQGGYSGEGNLTADPLLGPLGNYGGSTPTIPLQLGSPAINAGTATGAPSTDQRGTARPQGSGYDIGAYEYVVATTYAVTYDANGGTGTAPGTQTKTQGINLILASNSGSLTKTGSTFAGWNTAADGSGTSYATGATYSTDAALVLFAKWTANDSDSDGLPDWWEMKYSGSTTAMSAGGNTDGSGMSNFTKYAFGLDPTKGSSVNPIIDTSALHGAGQFSYTRAANSALTYTVWTSTDLSDWGTTPAAATQVPRVPAVDGVETVDVTLTGYTAPPGGKLFVRVKAQ